jgi:hypothetical protein
VVVKRVDKNIQKDQQLADKEPWSQTQNNSVEMFQVKGQGATWADGFS